MALSNLLGELGLDATLQAIRDKLPSQNEDGGAKVHVQNQVDVSALATNAALASLLTELSQKIEPADLAALAQDGTLSALSGKIGTPTSDDLLSLAREIRDNTAAESTTVSHLDLTADQVNLNTDQVESKLDIVSSRIGTTASAGTVAALLDAIRLNQINQAVTATVSNFPASQAVTGPLTDAQLRAAAVPVDSELPAAAALTDADSNPTVPGVAAYNMVWNGVNFKRLKTNTGDGDGSQLAVHPSLYNGTGWDRVRSALGANTGILSVAGDSLVTTGSVTATGDVVNVDARAYRWANVQITGTFVGTYVFETSNDGSAWTQQPLYQGASAGNLPTSSGSAPVIAHGPLAGRFFRIRCSAYTSGTMSATVLFSASPAAIPFPTANVGDGASASFPSFGGYVYNGATWDRLRTAGSSSSERSSLGHVAMVPYIMGAGTGNVAPVVGAGDGLNVTGVAAAGNEVWNGTGWDRVRSAAAATGTTGQGVQGIGLMAKGVTNYNPLSAIVGLGDGDTGVSTLATHASLWNGTGYDRARSVPTVSLGAAGNTTGVGVQAMSGLLLDNGANGLIPPSNARLPDAYGGVNLPATAAWLYNGSTWDRWRTNLDATSLASAARTTTTNGSDVTNYNASGVLVYLNVTAASGTGGLVVRVQGKDPVSGGYFTLTLAPSAVTANGIYTYEVYPGATGGNATQATSSALPRTWRVIVTHNDASSYTYSVGYSMIL